MAILASDIKLLKSERMRDTADGGGRQTGNEIVSGAIGNIFPKISRLDAAYGRVNLRKVYLAVRTANNDVYAGAHGIVSAPPANGRVGCVLFSTGSAFDMRDQARDRIESYVVAGPLSRMRLYGNQLIGQQAILTYQAETEPLPDVGDVLVLSVENAAGVASAQQYVRITDVSHEVRTFTDEIGDFTRRVLTLKIGSRLEQTFAAGEVSRFSADTNATRLRATQVADASQYYGIQATTEAADIGALRLRLASVYAPLVPSTNRETGVSLASISGAQSVLAAGTETITRTELITNNSMFIGDADTGGYTFADGFVPGSLVMEIINNNVVNVRVKDDGAGVMRFDIAGGSFGVELGEANYDDGTARIYLAGAVTSNSTLKITYVRAVTLGQPAHTRSIPVTLGTRGSVYLEALMPLPAPGTLMVDFRALGKWYRLRDDGTGVLVANDPSEGAGSVDYVTGAVIVTLVVLPDVDSAVIFSWGSPAHTTIRAGATTDAGTTLDLSYTLAHAPVVPGTLTVSYPVNGVSRNATDSAGVITGTGVTGAINYATGAVVLKFSTPPDASANVSNAYTWRDGTDLISTATAATVSGNAFTVPGTAPFRNGGAFDLELQPYAGSGGWTASINFPAYIRADGQVRMQAHRHVGAGNASIFCADQQIGTFNATTGVVTLSDGTAILHYQFWTPWRTFDAGGYWTESIQVAAILSASNIAVERDTTFSSTVVTGEIIAASTTGLTLDLTASVADAVVPGSVMFTATGKAYIERNGVLYTDVSAITGSGTAAGTFNYASGMATLTFWANNVTVTRSVQACLTQYGDWTAVSAYFRTSGSPLRPASLYVQCTALDGALITGTADTNGVITGTFMRGAAQQDMGVVEVEFGEMVTAAGNEAEPWYRAEDVVGGQIWRPREVMPSTLRYNCVVIANLPLDPDILGLDPVRLPSDGRVPIYRPGDTVVIHHTDTLALVNPVVAGATYSMGRTDLYSLALADATGAAVSTALYSVNLAAGTLTIDAGWTGAGITQPLTATHRVEDMALLSDVQINGQIELSAPTLHAYPASETYVSSALLYGDLQAIVTSVFDQSTWTGVWSDTLIGSQATAQFDDINYPITCLNESAVTERWRINFTSSTAFQVIGENLGVIATGTTSSITSPINPVTSEPYFSIPVGGWGSGWATGNQLRFNTLGASGPTWIARTILAGASLAGDQFGFEGRGDVD